MKLTRRMSGLAADALSALERRPHVVGVARDCNDRLILLLDRDDESTRREAERWAKSNSIEIFIKVIGKTVSNSA